MIESPRSEFAPPRVDSAAMPNSHIPTGRRARPGQVTGGWQIMLGVSWAAVFFAYAATWKVSEEIGIGTWWLGPRAQPQPLLVSLFPFVLATCVTFAAIYNVRRVAAISLGCSVLLALIAVGDISRSGGLALIEFAIAAAAALVSVGATTGTYRDVPAPPAGSALAAPTGRPRA